MNAERLLALYEKVAEAPAAIGHLRRFVLDLAVRGKLVEQDPVDEPASELVKRIAIERELVPKTGRSGKKKIIDPSLTALPFTLPDGWELTMLSELVRVVNGRAYKKTELLDEGTPVLRVGNLFTSDHWYYSNLKLEDDKYCEKGDLIYAWSASFGPFIWDGQRAIYHYHIWKLPLFSEADLDKQFLYLFLLQKTREIKDAGHGISMVHMTKEKMEQLAVPLPPLGEQHRIVAKVEELMALLDRLEAARTAREATRDRLTTASLARLTAPDTDPEAFHVHARFTLGAFPALTSRTDQIKSLRQTILNLAVRGKLVEQDPDDEPASELLKRIATEKSRLVEAGDIRKLKPPVPINPDEAPFNLPRAWRWVRLADILTKLTDGTHHSPPNGPEGEFLYITAKNIKDDGVKLQNVTYVSRKVHEEIYARCNPEPGDVLYIKDGATTGAVTVNNLDQPFSMLSSVALLKLPPCLFNQLVVMFLRSPFFYEQMRSLMKGAAITRVTLKRMGPALLPLPPLAEQRRIVAKVDALMALCDRLEAALATTDITKQRLLEALLHEALEPTLKEAA